MSSALAIASVTYVLKDLLNDGLINHDVIGSTGGNVTVSALPPDRIETGNSSEESRLNLFMYMATPNIGWRNQDFPSHNAKGERISNPPLALDLHYLLTAYGARELHHEILLGYGMQLLHEHPVLERNAIRRALALPLNVEDTTPTPTLSNDLKALSMSGLADQIEQIKITPETLNTEEISRLWTAFGAKYRPNAAYKVTVVLIESKKSTKLALPVRQRNLYVIPFRQPVIEKISSQVTPNGPILENQKILPGHQLVLSGKQLKGDVVSVMVEGTEVIPVANTVTDTQIIIPLPTGLSAGVHGVQVVHKILMGSPPLPHEGVTSNVQAFVLSPVITHPIAAPTNVQGTGNAPRSADITLNVTPPIKPTQRVVLFLNEISSPISVVPMAYSFPMPAVSLLSPPEFISTITIRVNNVQAGTYLVRIQVDGAESSLGTDASLKYTTPTVIIP